MNRRDFLGVLACMFSLLGVRKEAGKSVVRQFGSLKDEWRGMVAAEWWHAADLIETARDGKVTMTTVFRKMSA